MLVVVDPLPELDPGEPEAEAEALGPARAAPVALTPSGAPAAPEGPLLGM